MAPSCPSQSSTSHGGHEPMIRKRSHEPDSCIHRRTRVKLSPAASTASDSDPPLSEHSALVPTSNGDAGTEASEVESESGSDLEESSEEPSSESSADESSSGDEEDGSEYEDEDIVVNLVANRGSKPNMRADKGGIEGLRSRLKSFLPQLAAANEELEKRRQAGTLQERAMEAREDGEGQFIEMDLGLGVLEEKDPNAKSSESASDNSDDEDVMGKLLGRERKADCGIQEVDNA